MKIFELYIKLLIFLLLINFIIVKFFIFWFIIKKKFFFLKIFFSYKNVYLKNHILYHVILKKNQVFII